MRKTSVVNSLGQIHLQVSVWIEFYYYFTCVLPINITFTNKVFDSFQLPVLETQPNVTALDLQMKKLRDAALESISQMAIRMKEEATDVKATVGDIEDWLDRIKQLAEEVRRN